MITLLNQLQDGMTYTKSGNSFVPVSDFNSLANNSYIYIRSGNNVSIYKVDTSALTSSLNVGFGVTNPFYNVPKTSSEANAIITASKKLAVKIQAGLVAARKMQKKQNKGFLTTFFIGLALLTLLTVVLIATAPAIAPIIAGSSTSATTALPSGLGIAGASPSSAFLTAGSVIPSGGIGVGIITSSGSILLPTGAIATSAALTSSSTSIISKIGSVLGIASPAKAALTVASTAGKFYLTTSQKKQALLNMQEYQQAVAQKNTQKAMAIKSYYQKQLEEWESQIQPNSTSLNNTNSGTLYGIKNGTTLLDLKKYLPYTAVAAIFILIMKKQRGGKK